MVDYSILQRLHGWAYSQAVSPSGFKEGRVWHKIDVDYSNEGLEQGVPRDNMFQFYESLEEVQDEINDTIRRDNPDLPSYFSFPLEMLDVPGTEKTISDYLLTNPDLKFVNFGI